MCVEETKRCKEDKVEAKERRRKIRKENIKLSA